MSGFIKYLDGDLNQIGIQRRHVLDHCRGILLNRDMGFPPYFDSEKEFEIVLSSFWVFEVEGWWNYKGDLIRLNICTEDEFYARLSARVEANRARRESEGCSN